ncbi:MAG: Phosphoribosylformylglycinamidine synthase, PurS subunit, partial [uncultured Solirubrobacterales bacterium]
EGPRPHPPQRGHPRPPGSGGRARPACAWLRGRRVRARRPAGRARGRGSGARRGDVRAAAGQPAHRGLRGAGRGRRAGV